MTIAVYRAIGYPAYAGIDLYKEKLKGEKPWLPRIRGDRPAITPVTIYNRQATPHTRGSTLPENTLTRDFEGYPAYAGIDLIGGLTASFRTRLPRIRGDRPPLKTDIPGWKPATPHTRGSTPLPDSLDNRTPGYPAYAGIDPWRSAGTGSWWRLPRIRGDRPSSSCTSLAFIVATPHTRGSTSPSKTATLQDGGYPAYAGIDLTDAFTETFAYRLPRIRGDRPDRRDGGCRKGWATPHTRGSTCHSTVGPRKYAGYPAYAGIDP